MTTLISGASFDKFSNSLQLAEGAINATLNAPFLKQTSIYEWRDHGLYETNARVTHYFDINLIPYSEMDSRDKMQKAISQMQMNIQHQQNLGFGMGRCVLMAVEYSYGKLSKTVCQLMLRLQLLEKSAKFVRERFTNCKAGEQTTFCRSEYGESNYIEALALQKKVGELRLELTKDLIRA